MPAPAQAPANQGNLNVGGRKIVFKSVVGRAAHGDVENRSNALQFNTGYTLRFGPMRTGPLASLEWIHGALEGYRETGGGSAALDFPGQTYDSLVSRLGWQASYTAKTGFAPSPPRCGRAGIMNTSIPRMRFRRLCSVRRARPLPGPA